MALFDDIQDDVVIDQKQLNRSNRLLTTEFASAPEPIANRSIAGEMGSGFKRGLFVAVPEMAGGAIKSIAGVDSDWYKKGQDLQESAQAIAKLPEFQKSATADDGLVNKVLVAGAEGVGQMAPIIAGSVINPYLGAAGAAAMYAGSTYQDTKERMLKQDGLDDQFAAANPDDPRVQKAKTTGLATGAVQGLGEGAMSLVGGKFVTASLPALGKATTESVLKRTVAPGMTALKEYAKGLGLNLAGETITEPLQDEGQAAIERAAGLKDAPKFMEQAAQSAQGGFGTALLLAPFGIPAHVAKFKHSADPAINAALSDPTAPPEARVQAAQLVAAELKAIDPAVADNFVSHAMNAIGGMEETGSNPYGLNLADSSLLKPFAPDQSAVTEDATQQPPVPDQSGLPDQSDLPAGQNAGAGVPSSSPTPAVSAVARDSAPVVPVSDGPLGSALAKGGIGQQQPVADVSAESTLLADEIAGANLTPVTGDVTLGSDPANFGPATMPQPDELALANRWADQQIAAGKTYLMNTRNYDKSGKALIAEWKKQTSFDSAQPAANSLAVADDPRTDLPALQQQSPDVQAVQSKIGSLINQIRQGTHTPESAFAELYAMPEYKSLSLQPQQQGDTAVGVDGDAEEYIYQQFEQAAQTDRTPAAPAAPAKQQKPAPSSNPQKDDLVTAIAKMGGVSADQVRQQAGTTLLDDRHQLKSGIRHAITKNGKPLDSMREALVEQGYLPEGSTTRDLIDAMIDHAQGKPSYSNQRIIDHDALLAEQEARQLQDMIDMGDIPFSLQALSNGSKHQEDHLKAIGQAFMGPDTKYVDWLKQMKQTLGGLFDSVKKLMLKTFHALKQLYKEKAPAFVKDQKGNVQLSLFGLPDVAKKEAFELRGQRWTQGDKKPVQQGLFDKQGQGANLQEQGARGKGQEEQQRNTSQTPENGGVAQKEAKPAASTPASKPAAPNYVTQEKVDKIRSDIADLRTKAAALKEKKRVFQNGQSSIVSATNDQLAKSEALYAQANNLESEWYAALHPSEFSADEMKDAISKGFKVLSPNPVITSPQPEKPATAKPATTPTTSGPSPKPGTVTDAGEELKYNKRNRVKGIKWEDVATANDALKAKQVQKSTVYPKPDYQALVDNGMPEIIAHLVKQVYDAVPNAPVTRGIPTDEDFKTYITAVNRVMDGAFAWAENRDAVSVWAQKQARVAGAMQGQRTALSDLANVTSLYDTVYPGGWRAFATEVRILGSNTLLARLQPGYDEARRAIKDLEKGWPGKVQAWQRQGMSIGNKSDVSIREQKQSDGTMLYVIDYGKRDYLKYVDTRADADAFVDGLGDYLLLTKYKRLISSHATNDEAVAAAKAKATKERDAGPAERGMNVSDAERTGPAHRLPGQDVSSQQVMDTFGFRGINFGNWVPQDERQLHLNHLYDSFFDLAELLGVPPKAVSLNGMLGIAVGAQGGGNASAHFVPGLNEINVTRTAGAGALAHEWGHAVDHYFGNMAGFGAGFAPYLSYNRKNGTNGTVRPEIVEAFKRIVTAMKEINETPEQVVSRVERIEKSVAESFKRYLARMEKHFTAAPEAVQQQAKGLFDKLRAEQFGDGYVSISSKSAVFPVVADLYQLNRSHKLKLPLDDFIWLHQAAYSVNRSTDPEQIISRHQPVRTSTNYLKQAQGLDAKKQKPYWSTPEEMFARAFDAYLTDRLQGLQRKNSYLSELNTDEQTSPQGAERTGINQAFDALLGELKTRETEKGVALYSATSETGSLFTSGLESDTITDKKISQIKGITPVSAVILRNKGLQPVEVQGETSDMLRSVADRFGLRVMFYRAQQLDAARDGGRQTTTDRSHSADGFITGADKKTIFLNVNSGRHLQFIIGHEISHALDLNNEKAYQQLLVDIFPYLNKEKVAEYEEYLKTNPVYSKLDTFGAYKEVVADALGELFVSKNGWSSLAVEKPTLFSKLADAVIRVLDKIKELFTNKVKPATFFTDYAKVNRILMNAIKEYADNNGSVDGLTDTTKEYYSAAWHGSPHDHNGFSTEHIGAGEGQQVYGWGLYFAGNKEVAEWYRDKLVTGPYDTKQGNEFSRAIKAYPKEIQKFVDEFEDYADRTLSLQELAVEMQNVHYFAEHNQPQRVSKEIADFILENTNRVEFNRGRLYKVELAPAEDEYLLWDKPLSEQSEKVKASLAEYSDYSDNMTGREIYEKETGGKADNSNAKIVSGELHSLGIRGIKYLDGNSRNRPMKDIKKAFLSALPEDAEFSDVMELVGTGKFSPEQEALLKALEADDWLGFDYPAQAISAALGNDLNGFDPSKALSDAVAELPKDQQFNYVIFNDADVTIEEKFSLTSPAGTGLNAADLQREFDGVPFKSKIKVVQTAEELPGFGRKSLFSKMVEGQYKDGTIYLVAGNLTSVERARIVALGHELTHAGQNTKLVNLAVQWFRDAQAKGENGSRFQQAAMKILKEEAKKRGYDIREEADFVKAVKEATAVVAEYAYKNGDTSGLMTRLFIYLKHWLRKQGIAIKFSDKELLSTVTMMMRQGEQNLTNSTGPDGGQFSTVAPEGGKEYDKGNQGGSENDKSRTQRLGTGRHELLSKPDEYGKHVTTRETDHIEQSEKIRGIDEFARWEEDSPAFKSWARGRDVVDIDTLQQMKPSEFDGKPSVFKVYSAQVPDLDHWDMDVALGYKGDAVASGANKVGAFWGVSQKAAQDHQEAQGFDPDGNPYLNISQYYVRAENPVYYNTGGTVGDIHPQQILRQLRSQGHDVAIVDGLSAGRVVLHLDGHYNPAIKKADNVGTFSDKTSDMHFSLASPTDTARDKQLADHLQQQKFGDKTAVMVSSLFDLLESAIPPKLKANMGKILNNPWWGSEGNPIRRAIVNLNLVRSHVRNALLFEIMKADGKEYEGIEGLEELLNKGSKQDKELWNKIIKQGDIDEKWYTDAELKAQGVNKLVIKGYRLFHKIVNKINQARFRELKDIALLPYKNESWFDDLKGIIDLREKLNEGLEPAQKAILTKLLQSLKDNPDLGKLAKKQPEVVAAYKQFMKQLNATSEPHLVRMAYRHINDYHTEIDKIRNEWGFVKGYAPRMRKDGDWHVSVYRIGEADGAETRTKVFMKPVNTELGARQLIKQIKQDMAGHLKSNFKDGEQYVVGEPVRDTSEPGELLSDRASNLALESLVNSALDDAGIFKTKDVDVAAIKRAIKEELANKIMAQGFSRHGIKRDDHLIEGYRDDDYLSVLKEFGAGQSGWLSKIRYATEVTREADGIAQANPDDKVWVHNYYKDSMRNSTYLDEIAATARSVGAVYYLGFKASSALINAFQNYTVGQAELSSMMKKAGKKGEPVLILAKAQNDVLRSNMTDEEKMVLDKAIREGTLHAQAVRAMSGLQEQGFGGKWKKFAEAAMTPFSWVEQHVNREPAMLAAYRVFRDKATPAGQIDAAAFAKAEEFVNNTQFLMGNENLPELVRMLGPVGKTAYLFQGYVHNYLLWLAKRGRAGEFEAIARSFGAIALLGGAFALPGGDDLDKWIEKWFGVSYKLKAKQWISRQTKEYGWAGYRLEGFINHGLPSVFGVDMSRAIAVNLPFMADTEKSFGERVGGVWSGLAKKPGMAASALQSGDYLRAVENLVPEFVANPMRAARQYRQGATTLAGKPIFDETGRQMKYGIDDAAKKALGFNPLDVSEQTELRGHARSLKAHWNDKRDDALAQIRKADNGKQILEIMQSFNKDLKKSQAYGPVGLITVKSVHRARNVKPNKKQLQWQQANG